MENSTAPASANPPPAPPSFSPGQVFAAISRWIGRQPLQALLAITLIGTLVYFYGYLKFVNRDTESVAQWAWESWNDEGNMQHGKLVPLIFLGLLWYHRGRLATAMQERFGGGLFVLAAGVLAFVAAYCTAQPRVSLFALPLLILGTGWFAFGKRVARILLFPCGFLLFAINTGFIENTTFQLQFIISGAVNSLSNLIGVHTYTNGTTISSLDGTFNFDIVGGCSGIRSLFAMAMLTSIYVHIFQRELWKKVVIFAASLFFAVIGNICRVFTIVVIAKFISKDFAETYYHDYSDFVFFPCALAAMVGFARLLNLHLPASVTHPSSDPKSQPVKYDY